MDTSSLTVLAATAASIGFIHTVTGPDHYLPFVAMSRVGGWSLTKTIIITVLCGIGHVLSSVVLGAVGIGVGAAVGKLEWFESIRGNIAGWLLLGFGLAYMAWGIRRAIRNQGHVHWHAHADGVVHAHHHGHHGEHAHPHAAHAAHAPHQDVSANAPGRDEAVAAGMTPWILFTIFVFGPCEPLIPLLMYPAAKHNTWGVIWITSIFGAVTIATMTTIVVAAYLGLTRLHVDKLGRYSHAAAGAALALCGMAVTLGL